MRIGHGSKATALVLLAGCLATALAPASARAQGGYLIFQAGYYVPTQDLGVLADAGFGQAVEFGERERSFAYSLGLELAVSGPISGRATLAYATSADLAVQAGMVRNARPATTSSTPPPPSSSARFPAAFPFNRTCWVAGA